MCFKYVVYSLVHIMPTTFFLHLCKFDMTMTQGSGALPKRIGGEDWIVEICFSHVCSEISLWIVEDFSHQQYLKRRKLEGNSTALENLIESHCRLSIS